MLGIDPNILLYSLNPASTFQSKAFGFLKKSFLEEPQGVAIADYVLVELYLLLRNKSVVRKPLVSAEAVELFALIGKSHPLSGSRMRPSWMMFGGWLERKGSHAEGFLMLE